MTEILLMLFLLSACVSTIWIVANRAGKLKERFENAKKAKEDISQQNDILADYINLSSEQLLNRVREKRKAAEERLRGQNRLD